MKIALLSDIHANLRALDACVAHAQEAGAGEFAILGDLVGYGAQPAEVVQRVRDMGKRGAIVLQGNHDALALGPNFASGTMGEAGAGWTHAQLRTEDLEYLAALPLTARSGPVFLVHASADEPEAWHYVDNPQRAAASLDAACADPTIRYVFGGHVHEQTLYFRTATQKLMRFEPTPGVAIPLPPHRRWLATVGSVGQPRDGLQMAMYALFDLARSELTFCRVPYDHLAAAADIRETDLPEFFALRLEQGR
jgi:diadenosine tetraphosphatase ApaH/serine/threonine PP2A family protein phosphatase